MRISISILGFKGLTETSPCLPRVTTGDHLVLSITNRQNHYGLEECCQIPLEELQKSSVARYSISDILIKFI